MSLRSLSLAGKVGQLFVAGFDGTTPTDDIERLITERRLGGIIYFSRNIESPGQLRTLSRGLQQCVPTDGPPLLVAIDQEGGRVARLPWDTALPSAMALGAANDAELTETAGEAVGRELRRLGITVNLAPVLDVTRPDNPVIGVRSFGDCETVAEQGAAFGRGLQSANIVACGKHFPGHGATTIDSHLGLPVVDHDRDRLARVELRPFRAAIDAGIDMIMTAHVAVPSIGMGPATVSRPVVTGLLREELGFDGLVITDCMEMNAITDGIGTAEGAVQAIEAGCDLITVSHSPELQRAAIDSVISAVETGRISEDRIDASVRRIIRIKQAYDVGIVDCTDWLEAAKHCHAVAETAAKRGVTLVRDAHLPLPTDEPITVYEFENSRTPPETETKSEGSRKRGPFAAALSTLGVDVNASIIASDALNSLSPSQLNVSQQTVVCTADVRNHPAQKTVVRGLAETDTNSNRPIVLAVKSPYDLTAFPDRTALATYDDTPASLVAAAEVLIGKRTPTGQLPISIPQPP